MSDPIRTMNGHVFQENDSYCAPAIIQMLLKQKGIDATQQDIAKELETDMEIGTSVEEFENFLNKRGFVASHRNNVEWEDITKALNEGIAIVGYIEPEGDAHYSIVSKTEDERITLKDPSYGENFSLSKKDFLERWRDNPATRYGERMLMIVKSQN